MEPENEEDYYNEEQEGGITFNPFGKKKVAPSNATDSKDEPGDVIVKNSSRFGIPNMGIMGKKSAESKNTQSATVAKEINVKIGFRLYMNENDDVTSTEYISYNDDGTEQKIDIDLVDPNALVTGDVLIKDSFFNNIKDFKIQSVASPKPSPEETIAQEKKE